MDKAVKSVSFVFLFSLCFFCVSCQEKESYWKIQSIYKEDGQYLRGMSLSMMEAIVKSNIHFVKNGDTLKFDFPEKNIVLIDTLRSLSNERFDNEFYIEKYRGQLTDSIYFIGIEKGSLKIKFINSYTGDDDKRTVIEFRKLSEEEYLESLAKADSTRKEQERLMAACVANFKECVSWEIPLVKIKTQKFETVDKKFVITLPDEYSVEYRGSMYSDTFDKLKVGFASDENNSKYYGIENVEEGNDFDDPMLIFSKDSKDKFDYNRYVQKFKKENIVYQDQNCIVSLETAYDTEEEKAYISRVILFKYMYTKDTHVIFDNDILIKNNDFSLMHDQFRIMKTLNVK